MCCPESYVVTVGFDRYRYALRDIEPWGHRLPRRSSLRLHHLPARNGASSTRYHRSRDPPSSALHGPWGAPSSPGTLASPPSVGGLAPHPPCSGCSHHGYPSAGRLSRGPRYQWRSRPERRSAVASTQKPISPCPRLSDVSSCCSTFACFTMSLTRPFRLFHESFQPFSRPWPLHHRHPWPFALGNLDCLLGSCLMCTTMSGCLGF